MKIKILITITLVLSTISAKCQLYNYGQERFNNKWLELKCKEFKIIYPENFSVYANQTAQYMQWLYSEAKSKGVAPKRIPTVIHSDGGISNGMVTWAPRITNLYALPPQNTHGYWLEHLVSHEFKHSMQMESVNKGFTKALYYLFGDLAPIVVLGAYIPTWYLEGDAVVFETTTGNIGRGRDPEFLNEMRAQVVEKGIYPYKKAYFGSIKRYVPNHYTLGYYITAMGRIEYGNDIWDKALTRVAKRPYGITPFSTSLRKTTNLKNARQSLYQEIFNNLHKEWSENYFKCTDNIEIIPTYNTLYTNYYSPIAIGQDSVIAYKQGKEEFGAIVLLNNGEEKILCKTGAIYDKKLAYNNGILLWSEYNPHPRYSHSGKETLRTYNTKNGEYKVYRYKNNRYATFATHEGWGCIEILPNGVSDIVIFNNQMEEIDRIHGNFSNLYVHPTYSNGKVYSIVNSPNGNSIISINLSTKLTDTILPATNYTINYPAILNNELYFCASFNTNNAIYRISNGKPRHIAESKYGISMPSCHNNILTASQYTADGYKPIIIRTNNISVGNVEYKEFNIAEKVSKLEQFSKFPVSQFNDTIKPKRYNRFASLINIHSWGPLYLSTQEMDIRIGASIYTQNTLNTFAASAGYIWKEGYNRGAYKINATYQGWWPIVSINGEFGKKDITATDGFYIYKFNPRYNKLSGIIQLPLYFTQRGININLNPYLIYNLEGYSKDYTNPYIPLLPNKVKFNGRYAQYGQIGLNFSIKKQTNAMELQPKYGITINSGIAKEINNFGIGDTWNIATTLHLPGIFNNHGISIYGGVQSNTNKSVNYYTANILRPRGVTLTGSDYRTIRADYTLPIAYPDSGIGTILYFKRVYGTLFYDYGTIKNGSNLYKISSIGAELQSNIDLISPQYPINLGIRGGYETLTKSPFAELLFSISISL